MTARRKLLAGLGALLLAGAGLWLNREPLMLTYLGGKIEKRTLADQQALIEPFIHVFTPTSGAPPFPAIVQFHGCAGYRADYMEMWAKVGVEAGFVVVAVDSASPRGLDRDASNAKVCTGKALIGQERAGDIAAALSIVAARSDVDPARIVATGWSHGAWSLMDYLALTGAGKTPPSLTDAAGAASAIDPAGVILFYPYCGEGSWSRVKNWKTAASVMAFVGGKDTIVDSAVCRSLFEKMARDGTPVDLVYYPNADHVFDDATLVGGEHAHFYDPEAAADATAHYRAFLQTIKDRQ